MSEMDKLEQYLKENGILFERHEWPEMKQEQIDVFENKGKGPRRIWDAICGAYTYGGKDGLLEVMGKPVVFSSNPNDVVGWLTAEDVIRRLETGRA